MKKFDRLPPEQRKEEIRAAALAVFLEKGFAAATMENIVERVSLSKGGVYRLYPSTAAILSDLMLDGMRLRNSYYATRVEETAAAGRALTLPVLVEMIGDSLLLYPDYSAIYVEFLLEKRRNPELEAVYQQVCAAGMEETAALIHRCGAESLLSADPEMLARLTDLMNAAVLSLHVLHLEQTFTAHRAELNGAIVRLLTHQT